MRENGRSKYSWRSDPKDISDGLKSRKLYNETRGTRFDAETKIVRNNNSDDGCGCTPTNHQDNPNNTASSEHRRGAQSTMGLFGSSSSRGSRSFGGGGNGIFDKLMREASSDPSAQASKSSNPASWMRGVNSNVGDDKRAAIERQLKRVAQMETASKQSHLAQAPAAPMMQQAPQMEPQPAVQYITPLPQQPVQVLVPGPVACAAAQPLQPMGDIVSDLTSESLPTPPVGNGKVKAMLSKPENGDTFRSLRNELGDILLTYKLPDDVADKLRGMAKKLSDLDREMGS